MLRAGEHFCKELIHNDLRRYFNPGLLLLAGADCPLFRTAHENALGWCPLLTLSGGIMVYRGIGDGRLLVPRRKNPIPS